MAYDEKTPFDIMSIVEAQFGADAACKFGMAFAGRDFRVPASLERCSQECLIMIDVLGVDGATWLCEQLGSVKYYVPIRRTRKLVIDKMTGEGATVRRIVQVTGLSERQVYNLRAVRRRQLAEARHLATLASPEPEA